MQFNNPKFLAKAVWRVLQDLSLSVMALPEDTDHSLLMGEQRHHLVIGASQHEKQNVYAH